MERFIFLKVELTGFIKRLDGVSERKIETDQLFRPEQNGIPIY